MSTAVLTTGNKVLDMELPLLTEKELEDVARFAQFLRWSREDEEDDGSWADAPLTEEEEEAIRQGREDFKNGIYLTLDELLEGI